MILFQRKKQPSINGRLIHAAEGLGITLGCGLLGVLTGSWYNGVATGLVVVAVGGAIWEVLTPFWQRVLREKWEHPYGDMGDYLAFLGGTLPVVAPTLL